MAKDAKKTGDEKKKREEKPEGEPEELSLEDILYRFVTDIDNQVKKADDELKELEEAADTVRGMVYATLEPGQLPPELKEPDKFRQAIDALHGGVGKIIDYVLRLEKTRKKVETYMPREELTLEEEPTGTQAARGPQPVNVTVSAPQPPQSPQSQPVSGYWGARALIKVAQIQAELERERMRGHSVVTTKEVTDIVEFGRQMLPAFNKVKKWIPCALAQVRTFKNDSLYFLLHEEVGTFLSQTLGSLVSWVGACIEYRKNLLQGRKLGMARAIARIAEASSYSPKVVATGPFSDRGYKLGKGGFQER